MKDVIGEQVLPHRLEADEDEDALQRDALDLSIACDVHPLHGGAVPADLLDRRGSHRVDHVLREETVLEDRLRAKVAPAMNDVKLVREAREEEALLERAVAAADDGEIVAFEERPVAHRAVRDTLAVVLRLAGDAELHRFAADRDDDRVGAVGGAVLELDDLAVPVDADLLHARVRLDLEAELAGMLRHLLGELRPRHRREAGVVLDQVGVEDLATGVLALEEDGAHVGARRVQSRGEPGGPAADDDQVVIGQRGPFSEELPQTRTAEHSIGIPSAERWLALGDSFTIGTGTTPERSFPAILVRLWADDGRKVALRNPAVNGYRTDDLIAEELPLVAAFGPTLVTVLIGANDIVAGSTEDRYREQLRAIHARIRADAPEATVYALPQPDWSLRMPAQRSASPRRSLRGSSASTKWRATRQSAPARRTSTSSR